MELYTKSKSKTNVSLHCIAFNYIALLVTTSTLSTHIMTEKSNFLSMCSTCKSNNTATDPLCSTLSCYSMLDKCEVVADDPVSCMIHVRGSKLLGGEYRSKESQATLQQIGEAPMPCKLGKPTVLL